MLNNIIGLHIGDTAVSAVRVNQTLRGNRVTGCASVAFDPAAGDMATTLAQLRQEIDFKGAVCRCDIAASKLSLRNLNLPFLDPRKIRQALPFELETLSPFPAEELLTDFFVINRRDGQASVLAASVQRSSLAAFLAELRAENIDPEIVDIEHVPLAAGLLQRGDMAANGLILALDARHATLILYADQQIILVRSLPLTIAPPTAATVESDDSDTATDIITFCRAVRGTMHACKTTIPGMAPVEKIYLAGPNEATAAVASELQLQMELEVAVVDFDSQSDIQFDDQIADRWQPRPMASALALALRPSRAGTGFNFRREGFAVSTQMEKFRKEIRRVAVFGVIIAVLLTINLGVEYRSLRHRYDLLDQQLVATFTKSFPKVTKIVDPVRQMQVKLQEMKKSAVALPGIRLNSRVLDVLDDISSRIAATVTVQVTRMVVDQESIQIKGTTDTFNTVDAIKKGLEESDKFTKVTISSANLDRSGSGVSFELRLQRGQ